MVRRPLATQTELTRAEIHRLKSHKSKGHEAAQKLNIKCKVRLSDLIL